MLFLLRQLFPHHIKIVSDLFVLFQCLLIFQINFQCLFDGRLTCYLAVVLYFPECVLVVVVLVWHRVLLCEHLESVIVVVVVVGWCFLFVDVSGFGDWFGVGGEVRDGGGSVLIGV